MSVASQISESGVSAAVTSIGSKTTYSLWFKTINRLISNSFVIVTFPSEISLNTSTSVCTATSGTCAIQNSSALKVTLSSIVTAATNISISITNVANPLTTTPTSSFSIVTYYDSATSIVDQLNTGLIMTATSVPLKSVIPTLSSYTVNAKTQYTFSLQNSFSLPIGSIVKITFPADYT